MASPHVAGLAALVVQEHGRRQGRSGYSLDPDTVALIIENSATDHACPAGGVEIYTDEGRPAEFNAICEGTTDDNGLYGRGIANAAAAVAGNSRVTGHIVTCPILRDVVVRQPACHHFAQ